jgi:hypothetical protein
MLLAVGSQAVLLPPQELIPKPKILLLQFIVLSLTLSFMQALIVWLPPRDNKAFEIIRSLLRCAARESDTG